MVETSPKIPSLFDGSSEELWIAARAISDHPELDWTYLRFLFRVFASAPAGIDFAYENVSTWLEVMQVFRVNRLLRAFGLPDFTHYDVRLGMQVFDGVFGARSGILNPPGPDEQFRGRHAVRAIDSVDDETSILFANSWGEKWGDRGYGYFGQQYFEKHVDDATIGRRTWIGPSVVMEERIRKLKWMEGRPSSPTPEMLAQAWLTPNPIKILRGHLGESDVEIRRRMLYSFSTEFPLDIVEARIRGRFIGRFHLEHDRRAKVGVVDELWVPPKERRRGVGSLLDSLACRLAKDTGCRMIHIRLHEADAADIFRGRAEAFGRSLGYRWERIENRRPNFVGIAMKEI
ncbi:putative GNAT family N-acetyltransferase [Frankia sp. AiPs1]|uniref:GNAT family N-acetyltransferase n=1 Tax=Frankia sp. AiPa1 TaxID=573492 RepID=UPI00202B33DB|nr:GNAT family N-acetyltransferase [Frankia sp. AiPa1]MCL9759191.1 GNAT family N-acetyltransferase [Frankia sp. AiPa1]